MENKANKHSLIQRIRVEIVKLLCIMVCFITVFFPSVEASAATTVTVAQAKEKLNTLISTYNGKQWRGTYYNAIECKGFANLVFDKIFDLGGKTIGTGSVSSNPTNYILNDLNGTVTCLGTVYNGSLNEYSQLLKSVMPGDFIQMRRRSSGGPHSMIVVEVSESSLTVFDCNTDGNCTVKVYSQSFSEFRTRNIGFSVYRSKHYNTDYVTDGNLSILASDEGGYMVQCVVENSDLTGELKLASWAETRGTENVKWTSMVEVEKNVFKLYVPFSDHENIRDKYYNDVYIHYGQENMQCIGRIVFDHRTAYAEEFKVLDSDANGYMVQCIVNDSDITGELVLATWAESRGTEQAVWTKMVEVEKNVFKLYVPFSDHGNVRDKYYSDVYMKHGTQNEQCLERLLTFDHRLPEAESFEILDSDEGGYMVQCVVNNSDLTGELTLATWAESRGTEQAVWTKMVEVEKNVFKLYVPFSDHGNVRDIYYNDVYMKRGTDEEQCLGRLLDFDHRLIVPYGNPDFILPADIETIKESAFENSAMTIAYIPDGCRTISAYAFRNCKKLTQIRIPAGCTIADTAFYGCNEIYIFGKAGSSAESFCSNHVNCVFIEE